MYQPLLTRRYLASKVMPLLAAVAVTLCTAMVLIVWSVMGGFLNMLLASGKSMIGDVSIHFPTFAGGLAHYEEIIDELEEQPEVAVATPVIETYALLKLPDGDFRQVILLGVEPEGYDAVTGFYERLYWRRLPPGEREAALAAREAGLPHDRRVELTEDQPPLLEHGMAMAEPDPTTGEVRPAVVIGSGVSGQNRRTREGHLDPVGFDVGGPGRLFLPYGDVTLTVLAISERGALIEPSTRTFPVANEFTSGYHLANSSWVVMPVEVLQHMLFLEEKPRVAGRPVLGPDGQVVQPPKLEPEPGRVSHVLIKAAEGYTPKQAEAAAERVYAEVQSRHPADMHPLQTVFIYTWEEKPGLAMFIAAVKRETVMVVTLFAVISSVASFLIFAIFWSMISEKTKDIGVLRALGASRSGVAWLFLRYGIAIGVLGAALGLLLAWVFIRNINAIHRFLADVLGVEVWNPETYLFEEIPADLDWAKVAAVTAGAIVFSIIGALAPALRAARMDPVKALRFE